MSHVADVILVTAIDDGGGEDEHPNADRLEQWLQQHQSPNIRLAKVDQHAGGNKAMQCDVFLAAVNYLHIDEFVAAFRAIPWDHPERTQLMLKDEHDDRFAIYTGFIG